MKKTILLAAMAACLFATNVFAQKIKGSDTCLPLTQTEAENFMNKNKAAKITVTGGGSGNIITANGFATLEFCREILYALEADSSQKIERSYRMNKTGVWEDPEVG